jgi:hypothetical protein
MSSGSTREGKGEKGERKRRREQRGLETMRGEIESVWNRRLP